MTMLRVLIRAGPTTCLRHTVPVPTRTGAGLQEDKRRSSVRPRAGPKVHIRGLHYPLATVGHAVGGAGGSALQLKSQWLKV
jgi:hypothetical protein